MNRKNTLVALRSKDGMDSQVLGSMNTAREPISLKSMFHQVEECFF